MAATMPEPNAQWTPLEDGVPLHTDRTHRAWNLAKVGIFATGFLGLAAVAVVFSGAQRPASVTQQVVEMAALPSHLAQVTSVAAFNELLGSSIVIDAKPLYEAMSKDQFELIFTDFLATIGTQVPADGFVPEPKRMYIDNNEYKLRLDIFKRNMLSFLEENAAEHKRNRDSNRARFGITVHADWTFEEFENTRFTLKATNMTRLQAKVDKSVKATVPKVRKLGICKKIEGSCAFTGCNPSRGATCYENQCVCDDGACMEGSQCVRPGQCHVPTGGSCKYLGCGSWRNAQCQSGSCICPLGSCAVDGKCVAQKQPKAHPHGITCDKQYTGPVRNQGSCGSCWAFSAVQQLRFMTYQKYQTDPGTLSAQYLIDCDPDVADSNCAEGVKGCCGGLPFLADIWASKTGGIPSQAQYGPYKSGNHPDTAYTCHSSGKTVLPVGINQYTKEVDIANALCEKGPVSIAIAANMALMSYIGGVMTAKACPADQINHAVLYAGISQTHDNGKPAHVILNSWGQNWGVSGAAPFSHATANGINGHVLFKFGENVCNMEALATGPDDVQLL